MYLGAIGAIHRVMLIKGRVRVEEKLVYTD